MAHMPQRTPPTVVPPANPPPNIPPPPSGVSLVRQVVDLLKTEVLPLIEKAVSDALLKHNGKRAAWRDRDAWREIDREQPDRSSAGGEIAEEFGGQGSWQDWEATYSGSVELDGRVELDGGMELVRHVELDGGMELDGRVELDGGMEFDGRAELDGRVELYGGMELDGHVELDGGVDLDGQRLGDEELEVGGKEEEMMKKIEILEEAWNWE